MPPRTRLSVAFPASPSRRHHSRNAWLTALSPAHPLFRFSSSSKRKAPGKNGTRYFKNVGLGFKTPKSAIEGASRRRARARVRPKRPVGESRASALGLGLAIS
jgi:hypothetical protein